MSKVTHTNIHRHTFQLIKLSVPKGMLRDGHTICTLERDSI